MNKYFSIFSLFLKISGNSLNVGTKNHHGMPEVHLPWRNNYMAICPSYSIDKNNKNFDFLGSKI